MHPLAIASSTTAFLEMHVRCQTPWHVEDRLGPHTVNDANKLCDT